MTDATCPCWIAVPERGEVDLLERPLGHLVTDCVLPSGWPNRSISWLLPAKCLTCAITWWLWMPRISGATSALVRNGSSPSVSASRPHSGVRTMLTVGAYRRSQPLAGRLRAERVAVRPRDVAIPRCGDRLRVRKRGHVRAALADAVRPVECAERWDPEARVTRGSPGDERELLGGRHRARHEGGPLTRREFRVAPRMRAARTGLRARCTDRENDRGREPLTLLIPQTLPCLRWAASSGAASPDRDDGLWTVVAYRGISCPTPPTRFA